MENTQAMKRAALLLVVFVAAGCGTKTTTITQTQTVTKTVTKTVRATGNCTGAELSATFDLVPGSQGAGNVVYALKITNMTSSPCELGIIGFQLLDKGGAFNPTNVTPLPPTSIGANETLGYNARFSPDVNGTGDNTNGSCQPTSATLRIDVGEGSVQAPISPPTSVCEQGSMTFRAG